MATKIYMPALSPTMVEGSLSKWLIKVGDKVVAGDILAEIETDKATMEVEAVDEGVVTKLLIKEGTTSVPVNSTIAILDGNKEEIERENINENPKENKSKKNNINKMKLIDDLDSNDNKTNKKINKDTNLDRKFFISPYARKVSKQKGLLLSNIFGSGPNGRIIKRDLENENYQSVSKLNLKEVMTSPSLIRKIIAKKTTLTKQTVPHFYLTIESNVDKLIEMRKKMNETSDNKFSINDILVKALAHAQQINPLTNVSWVDDKIIQYNSIDVSIAVALNEGLITPIIKNANKKGLKEISLEIKHLVNKAKEGHLQPNEYNGGTISISNLGMYGITDFSAIINPPQSSILAVGVIKKIPGIVNNEIKVINVLKSTLSADHRVLDGAVAGKLLKDFNDIIEDPFNLWLMSNDMKII